MRIAERVVLVPLVGAPSSHGFGNLVSRIPHTARVAIVDVTEVHRADGTFVDGLGRFSRSMAMRGVTTIISSVQPETAAVFNDDRGDRMHMIFARDLDAAMEIATTRVGRR